MVDQETMMEINNNKKDNYTLCMSPRTINTKQPIPILIKAIRSGHSIGSVRMLLKNLTIREVNATDALGSNALMHVVESPMVNVATENITLPLTRETWCYSMFKLLLEHCANPLICNVLNENVQTIAVNVGLFSVRELLDSWTDRIECIRLIRTLEHNQTHKSVLSHMPDDIMRSIFEMLWIH